MSKYPMMSIRFRKQHILTLKEATLHLKRFCYGWLKWLHVWSCDWLCFWKLAERLVNQSSQLYSVLKQVSSRLRYFHTNSILHSLNVFILTFCQRHINVARLTCEKKETFIGNDESNWFLNQLMEIRKEIIENLLFSF